MRAVNAASPPGTVHVPDAARPLPDGVMSPRMRQATFALAEVLFATEEGPAPTDRVSWLCDDLDHFFAHAGVRARAMYGLCLLGIGLMAPLLIGRLPPLRSLSFDDRARALETLEKSPFALAVFGAKALLCIVYYEHPEVAARVGHDGACLGGRR